MTSGNDKAWERFCGDMGAGRFFDAHEALEEVWRTLDRASPEAQTLQGLIQGAVALEHERRGRPDRGARVARKAVPKLAGVGEIGGFDADKLRRRLSDMIDAETTTP